MLSIIGDRESGGDADGSVVEGNGRIQHLEMDDKNKIYLHCRYGIGRAALTGSCLASLIYPELTANEILDWIQRGYDTRAGAASVHVALQKSPQMEQQRAFVKEFVGGVQTIARMFT